MKLTHSSFYYKEKRTKTVEHNLLKRLEAICMECPGYGYRRVTYQLHRENIKVNHKKVLRLMKENDLLCRMKRRWVKTTQSGHNLRVYPNLVKGLVIDRINQVWLTDITYIRIKKGFVYLAAVLDAYSRRVIGHHLSAGLDTDLVLKALGMAIRQRKPGSGVIHHSDQGIQYASNDYVAELAQNGFRISMSRKGNPYDNATAESFFKTLKYEEVYLNDYQTEDDVWERIPFFIEEVYNQKRLHSALGYRPPAEFENRLVNQPIFKEEPSNGSQTLLTCSVQS
jgi:putative transposase